MPDLDLTNPAEEPPKAEPPKAEPPKAATNQTPLRDLGNEIAAHLRNADHAADDAREDELLKAIEKLAVVVPRIKSGQEDFTKEKHYAEEVLPDYSWSWISKLVRISRLPDRAAHREALRDLRKKNAEYNRKRNDKLRDERIAAKAAAAAAEALAAEAAAAIAAAADAATDGAISCEIEAGVTPPPSEPKPEDKPPEEKFIPNYDNSIKIMKEFVARNPETAIDEFVKYLESPAGAASRQQAE